MKSSMQYYYTTNNKNKNFEEFANNVHPDVQQFIRKSEKQIKYIKQIQPEIHITCSNKFLNEKLKRRINQTMLGD